MLLERFEDRGLAQYSYAVGCAAAGKVAVVDPRRDVDVYLEWAAAREVAIACVLETHIHADFASGARELATRAGAKLLLSAYDEGERYEVRFPHSPLHEVQHGGQAIELGSVRVAALHTPGHTPEHLSFLVYDTGRSEGVPIAALTGDFLFVGSLGRPDLLGAEATDALARAQFRSVREVLAPLPDGLEIHPGHGAGSMCGAGMSSRPFSTLGFERVSNPFLDPALSEAAFVARLLGSVPPLPPYYLRMKELNAEGPPLLEGLPGLEPLPPDRFRELAEDGNHVVVDLRDQLAFGTGHVPGALGIGVDGSLSTWAGWVVPGDRPILLVAERAEDVERASRALVRVGLDRIEGHLEGGMRTWRERDYPVAVLPQLSVVELAARLAAGDAPAVVDVRGDGEWAQGHLAGAVHLMGGVLPQRHAELPGGQVALLCGSGYRSTVAASWLQRAGHRDVFNVTGGMAAWKRAGLPVDPQRAPEGAKR